MKCIHRTVLVLAVAACAAFLTEPAFARQGRGRDDVAANTGSSAAGASLSIRMRTKSHGRFEFRMAIERAMSAVAPQAWIADASGTLVLAGDLVPDDNTAGEFRLRLRSAKGGVLPAGAASLAEMGGRAYEIRDRGEVIFSGNLPSVDAKRRGADDAPGHVRQGRGADDAKRRAADDKPGHVRRGRGADDAKRQAADDAPGHVRRGRGRDDR